MSNLSPLAEATGGSVRRVATKPDDTPRVPSIVALSGASRFAGADYIGIRITDSSVVRGVGVTPIFLGFIGLVLLAASLLAAWLGEARLVAPTGHTRRIDRRVQAVSASTDTSGAPGPWPRP